MTIPEYPGDDYLTWLLALEAKAGQDTRHYRAELERTPPCRVVRRMRLRRLADEASDIAAGASREIELIALGGE